MHIRMIVERELRVFGDRIAAGAAVQVSIATACSLLRTGRARLADLADLALVIDFEQQQRPMRHRPRKLDGPWVSLNRLKGLA